MNQKEILETLKLLSQLESWSFSQGSRLPDYLHERLSDQINLMTEKMLDY